MDMFLIYFRCKRYGMVNLHLVSTVPLRTGTAVDIHHFDFFHGEAFYSLFGGRGLDL